MQFFTLLLGASALITPALSQTFTLCNPLFNTTCGNDPGFGIEHNFRFNDSKAIEQSFNYTNGKLTYTADGSQFIINKQKESPTIQSKFYIMFGSISVVMRAASGQGIVSSIVIQSECLDEIDWEFIGGNGTHAQTNYFGKGNTTSYDRAEWHPVSTDVRLNFHNYTVDWTAAKMDFYIDSQLVRTLPYARANGGKNYPQTPSTVRLGLWAGGDVENNQKGVVEWAGGETDFAKGPFTMYVQSTNIKDYGTGKEYEWTDQTGNWQSIKAIAGNSTAAEAILKVEEPQKSVAEKFQELPSTSKVAIYAGAGAGAALLLGAFLFTCIRQRRKGRAEREAYNAKVEKERADAYKDQMELREKGLGGWDKGAYASQGDDALGGWGGTYVTPAAVPRGTGGGPFQDGSPGPSSPVSRQAGAGHFQDASHGPGSPILRNAGTGHFQDASHVPSSPISRHASPAAWNGGNQGGMIHNAHNAFTGGYGSNTNIPRSPNFPLASQGGFNAQGAFPPTNGGGFGSSNNGYHRF